MLWQREVGEGYSGPLVEGDRIWVQARQGGEEVVYSVMLDTGKTLWNQRYKAPFKQDPSAEAHGLGPYSTPALANGRLFTFSVTSVLSAWDAYKGTLFWQKEYSEEFKPSYPLYGTAVSPLVWEDRCFAAFGASGREGLDEKGAIVALRVSDGSEIWRWDGDGPALAASPVIAVIEGAPQLVSKTEENIVGLDPRTGKELWRIPFKVTQDNTIVTPLIMGNRLLTSDAEKGFNAWQIRRKGESFGVQNLWTNRAVSLGLSSPVVVAGQIVGFSHFNSGQLFGLDPSDGKLLWRGEPRWGAYVHVPLISWGEELLALREDGRLVVGKVSSNGFTPMRQYRLGSTRTWGHPAIIDGRIVIRDGTRLAVYQLMGETKSINK